MKNAFSRIGYTCVFGFAIAGAMLAAPIHSVNLTLPHAVTVGSATLPEGPVTVSTVEMNDGNGYLVVRTESGMAALFLRRRSISSSLAKRKSPSRSRAIPGVLENSPLMGILRAISSPTRSN